MIKPSKIEWMAVLKSVIFVTVLSLFVAIVAFAVFMVSLILITGDFENSFETSKEIEYVLMIPGVLALFFGFWKSLSFFPHHRFLHINIVAFIICVPDIVSVPFIEDYDWSGGALNTLMTYVIMLGAYGVREVYPRWRVQQK